MNYDCIICFEKCRKPVSCKRCKKLICRFHISKISDRCPNCRNEPYEFNEENLAEICINIENYREREQKKRQCVFKCLVEGCSFEGRYSQMESHRRGKHYHQKIDEMIFPEQRQNKKKRDALKRLFLDKITQRTKIYEQMARKLYPKTRGNCQISALVRNIAHIDMCKGLKCMQVVANSHEAYIASADGQKSTCEQAMKLACKY